jgi:hypothetical protein
MVPLFAEILSGMGALGRVWDLHLLLLETPPVSHTLPPAVAPLRPSPISAKGAQFKPIRQEAVTAYRESLTE